MSKTKKTSESPRALVDKDEVFRIVRYAPHAGQAAMHQSRARYRVLACGSRWGKSLAAAMEVVVALLQPADHSLGWIVAPTRDLADRILERVRAAFHQHMQHRIVEDDSRTQRLVIRNLGGGLSECRGKSADNAVSLLGESLDWLVVDEAAKLDRVVWESHLAARLLDRRGWALLLSTPSGPNWFWRLYRLGQRGRDVSHESWRSPSWENPLLDPLAIAEERRRLPSDAFAQEFAAEFIGADEEPCMACGCPNPDGPWLSVVETDEQLPRCASCQQLVDFGGKTLVKLWPGGKRIAKVVVLRTMPEQQPTPVETPEPGSPLQLSPGAAEDLELLNVE